MKNRITKSINFIVYCILSTFVVYFSIATPKLNLEITSNIKTNAQLFYKIPYSEELSYRTKINNTFQAIEIRLPSYDNTMRLDIADEPYQITIHKMTISLMFLDFPINSFENTVQIEKLINESNEIKMETFKDATDPQLYLKIDRKNIDDKRLLLSIILGLLLAVFLARVLPPVQLKTILKRFVGKLIPPTAGTLSLNVFIYIIILSILVITYMHQIYYPSQYDSMQYMAEAQSYASSNDLLAGANAKMRLYGYPIFLAIFFKLFPPSLIASMLFIVQTLLYIIAVLLVSSSLGKVFPKAKVYVYFALLSNVFLYPYLPISLSDSLSVILWLIVAYLVIEIFLAESLKISRLLFFLGLTIGFSIMVRPANIQLIVLIPAVLILWFHYKKSIDGIRVAFILSSIAIVTGFMIAVLPQIYINYNLFDKISFLPAMNLGDAQISWGINNLKYATNISGIGSPGMFYTNPLVNEGDIAKISWYFLHPLEGIITFFLHIFGALDFDYLFPYIYELNPKYQILTFVMSQTILFYGVYGYFKSIKLLSKKSDINSKIFFSLLVTLIPIIAIGWGGIVGLSVPENRFSLPMVSLLLPFAFFAIHSSWRDKKVIFIFALWLIIAYMLSSFITMQKVI